MKGQLEIQFNWIFVIIIGAVLLGFFFVLINTQANSTELQISISQTRYFETIVTSSGQEPGTFKKYELDNFNLDFFCDNEQEVYYYSLADIQARDTKYDLLFSPDSLQGDDLLTWTQLWDAPYQVAIFQYVTNSDHGFIFYNFSETLDRSTRDFEELYEGFSHNFTTYVMDRDYQPTAALNLDSYTYVFLKDELPSRSFLPLDLVDSARVILIDPAPQTRSIFEYGDIYFISATRFEQLLQSYNPVNQNNPTDTELFALEQFLDNYESDSQIQKTSYVGKASLYGSLFVDSAAFYDCTMEKAANRLRLQTLMHYERVESFKGRVGLQCEQQLGIADQPALIRESDRFPRKRLLNLAESLNSGFSSEEISSIYADIRSLEQMNNDLELTGNCPVIY